MNFYIGTAHLNSSFSLALEQNWSSKVLSSTSNGFHDISMLQAPSYWVSAVSIQLVIKNNAKTIILFIFLQSTCNFKTGRNFWRDCWWCFHFTFCWQSILMSEWITPTKGGNAWNVELWRWICANIKYIFSAKVRSFRVISIENEQRHGSEFLQNFIKREESLWPQHI